MNIMIVGLNPEYAYPGDTEKWRSNNTRHAANFGASFITRSLLRQFKATFVDEFDDIAALNTRYDACILALATHIHGRRDVSLYADLLEKLDMPVFAFSLGIEDYRREIHLTDYPLDPTVRRMLDIVSERSAWLGVRGPHSATALLRNGYRNVVPIGCPSLFWSRTGDIDLKLPDEPQKPVIVFHRTLAEVSDKLPDYPMLGQDFQDEQLMTDNLEHDRLLVEKNERALAAFAPDKLAHFKAAISKQGVFQPTFADWLDFLTSHDLIVGPRLHGCLAALAHGIPAIMVTRDLRTQEIASFFDIPRMTYEDLASKDPIEIYRAADFNRFENSYKQRFADYRSFLADNGLPYAPEDGGLAPAKARDDVQALLAIIGDLYGHTPPGCGASTAR